MTERLGVATEVAAFDDDRGRLVAIEFADLPLLPVRTFVVVGPDDAVTRGGHVAGCWQLVILVTGSAVFRLASGTAGSQRVVRLDEPGSQLLLDPEDLVEYDLTTPGSTLLVLADRPFTSLDRTQ